MTDLRTAAQQALEAWDQPNGINYIDFRPYMDALRAALAEPVQAPVAWLLQSELDDLLTCNHRRLGADSPRIWAPFDISSPSPDMGLVAVYTAPPQRKPLTDEELDALAIDEDGLPNSHIEFARAIERAHGIGGQP